MLMPTVTTIPATKRLYTGESLATPTIRKVAGYARVSTDHEDQITSYEAQVDYYTRYISEHAGWQLAGIYTDEGITGTSTKHREGFKSMVADALAGRIDLILTKSVSRFARNTVDTLTTVRKLKDKGVEVYFEKENIWTLDAKGELLITIMSSLAQEEARSISENVTWGHRKRFADGKAIIPYKSLLGYKRGEGDRLVIDETQAPTVQLIYRLFLDGKSIIEIKHILESKGLITVRGKKTWSTTTIRSILTNEKYRGDLLLQKTIVTDFLTKQTKINEGEAPQYYVSGDHEPIIAPAAWDQVQYELATRHANSATAKKGLFATRLKCTFCRAWYGRKTWASTSPSKHTVWQCNHKYQGDQICASATLRDQQIEDAFLGALNQLADQLGTHSHLDKIIEKTFATDELQTQHDELTEKLEEYEASFDKLIAENQQVAQDQGAYLERFSKLETDYQHTQAKVQAVNAEIKNRRIKKQTLHATLTQLQAQPIQKFRPSQWTALIDYATVSDTAITFTFKTGTEITIIL